MHPIVETRRTELAALCRRFHVRRLDLFGSAATGEFDPCTVISTFWCSLSRRPDWGGFNGDYFGLREALVELFGREVDLTTERSVVNPYLRAQIEAERCTLFERAA